MARGDSPPSDVEGLHGRGPRAAASARAGSVRMRRLLDTNTCIALLRDGSARVAREFERATAADGVIAISSLVVCELWYGVYKSSRRQDNAANLLRFLRGPVEMVSFDDEDARAAGEIRGELARTGKTIGSYDTLIAGQ